MDYDRAMIDLFKATALLLLAGCATSPQDASNAMMGMSRAEILACAGAPHRAASDGNLQVLTYERFVIGRHGSVQCDTTITLSGGRVSNVDYSKSRNPALCRVYP